jgi:hypothetical protein
MFPSSWMFRSRSMAISAFRYWHRSLTQFWKSSPKRVKITLQT